MYRSKHTFVCSLFYGNSFRHRAPNDGGRSGVSTEPRVIFRYFRWLFPVRSELSLHIYLDISPVTGQIAKAEEAGHEEQECSSRPKPAFPLGVSAARQQAQELCIDMSIYRIIHCTLFRRPQYPELWGDHRRRRWRSNSGLPLVSQYGQVRTVHLNTFVGRGTRESHTLCPPRGGCEKPPRE